MFNNAINETEGTGISSRMAAMVAGVSLLIMAVAAIVATVGFDNVFEDGDAAATANNILDNEFQFRLAVISFVTIIVLDVIVAWALYVFFRPVNRDLSMLAAWLRVVYVAVFLTAILNLVNAVNILQNSAPGTDQAQAEAWLAINAFQDEWALSLAIFGLHLIAIGYLIFKADEMPLLLAGLVVIAGIGYVFDALTGFLFPDFGVTVGLFTFIGEVILAFWLIIKSVRFNQQENLAVEVG